MIFCLLKATQNLCYAFVPVPVFLCASSKKGYPDCLKVPFLKHSDYQTAKAAGIEHSIRMTDLLHIKCTMRFIVQSEPKIAERSISSSIILDVLLSAIESISSTLS